jgi:hypothetical protein
MNRREMISLSGTVLCGGLSGCLNAKPKTANISVPENRPYRRVTIESQDSLPEQSDVSIQAKMVTPTVTDEQAPKFSLTITNNGQRRALSENDGGGCRLFERQNGGSRPQGLWVHPPKSLEEITRLNELYARDRDPSRQRDYGSYGCSPRLYERGESITNEYVIWHDYRSKGYYQTGTYTFEDNIGIWQDPQNEEGFDYEPDKELSWRLTLQVSE